MQLKQILFATLASIAFVNAVAVPEPQTVSPAPTYKCGCTNACIIACAGKSDCICPQYCDPQYECVPTKTTSYTPIKPTATCGCLNDCIVGCPDLRLCKCADYCDPKYACTTTTTKTVKPTKTTATPKPTPTCGCTNDCFVNCPPGKNCICPLYCDPKYACPITTTKPTKTTTSVKPTFTTCGCLNDCVYNCTEPSCACPKNCDPKYACPTLITKVKARATLIPTPISTGIPCGCYNSCTIACGKKPGKNCICPDYCDPKYACTV